MKPDHYAGVFDILREVAVQAVESVPADKIHFTPPYSRSMADIALHMIQAENNIISTVCGLTKDESKSWKSADYPTQAAILTALIDSRKQTLNHIHSLTSDQMDRVIPSPMGTEGPAETWLSMLVVHESDHMGNLVMLAKTMGCDAPDIKRVREARAQAAAQ